MNFDLALIHGTLVRRMKRFLAEVILDDGSMVFAHCTNSGSMKSCLEEGAEVFLSPATNPDRWTRFTWEMIKINNAWVGINTVNPNKLIFEALQNNKIPGINGFHKIIKEARYRDSRFDFYLEKENEKCFIEVKNVTLKEGEFALFPDAVTIRGRKHLLTLVDAKTAGYRAIMIYVIQRMDVNVFAPAWNIDPEYGKTLKFAIDQGIEIIPLQAKVTPENIEIFKTLSYNLNLP